MKKIFYLATVSRAPNRVSSGRAPDPTRAKKSGRVNDF